MEAQGRQAAGQKVPVLEEKQQGQVEDHRRGHRHPRSPVVPLLLALVHQHAVGVVDGDGGEHDDDIDRLAPAVEDEVEDQQHAVAPLQGREVVDQKHNGQVGEEKEQAGENQAQTPQFDSMSRG